MFLFLTKVLKLLDPKQFLICILPWRIVAEGEKKLILKQILTQNQGNLILLNV